ncbi:unnamed protein product [Triticum turgidum subsp. durum]|uniref:Shaggy-related protein kinase eta n=1 Tax=Triticum turgidum subsp. durum TaxID=4567 RepID=A0A9R1QC37_TRITD|nr:unnamed protein product [Triticum turgidum subsp. durum]
MNPNYTEFRFPQIKAHPWHKIFHKRMPAEAIDLASRLLQYSPNLRCTVMSYVSRMHACRMAAHSLLCSTSLANASPELINRLVPEHVRRQNGLNFAHAGS